MTSHALINSLYKPCAAPHDAFRASLVDAHHSMLRHARRSGGDDACECGAVYAAIGRRDETAEADTERELADGCGGDLAEVQSVCRNSRRSSRPLFSH